MTHRMERARQLVMPSSERKPIVLYDIPCRTPGRPWSPNTMKTRYCLGYKQLSFTTVWIEFPDIACFLQSKGIAHPPSTLPAIEDPNTGSVIMDSLAIATYLDETYPETPTVLSHAARAALKWIGNIFSFGSSGMGVGTAPNTAAHASESGDTEANNARKLSLLVFLVLGCERLNPVSKTYCYQTRAVRYGERWTTLVGACSASLEERAECVRQGIEAIKATARNVATIYEDMGAGKLGERTVFALGDEPCFLDFMVAGRIKFVLDGLTQSEARAFTTSDGKRLAHLVDDLEVYFKY